MPGTAIRFKSAYQNYDPATIFQVDQATKTLSPFGSGQAYQDAGFQFGQEQVVDANAYQGYGVGPIINGRDAGLAQVKNDLNQFQNTTFNQGTEAPKRASSTLTDKIATASSAVDSGMAEFNALLEKYKTLQTPNYQQAYTDLRTEAGIPGLEQQYAGVRQTRRELPYTERAVSGNAGVMTEGQLGANVAQKDIPLGIQEQNLIDRMQLASDFVNQSLKFKELDATTSRTALENAINLVSQAVTMSRGQLSDLTSQQGTVQARRDAALKYAQDNGISTPFFNVAGTIYSTADLTPFTSPEDFKARTGIDLATAESKGMIGKPRATSTNVSFSEVGKDANGNTIYGFVDKNNQTVTPYSSSSSSNLGVPQGTILGLPTYDTAAANPGVNRPNRNNNPGNIKASNTTVQYEGVVGVESRAAADGGNFLIFSSPQAGINAIAKLLQTGSSYQNVSAEAAIKKYNGGGAYSAASLGMSPTASFQSELKRLGAENVAAGIAKLEGFTGTPAPNSASDAATAVTNSFNAIAPRLTDGQRKSAQASINQLISSGDIKGATEFIVSTAIAALPAEQQNKAFGRMQAIDSLDAIETLLSQFAAKGGSTNILTGSIEKLAERAGATGNQELAYIASQIQLAMIAYRSSVSGAAFTESEMKQYDALFPSIGDVPALNDAKIRSLRDAFNRNQKNVLQTVIGSTNYDAIMSPLNSYAGYAASLLNSSPEDTYLDTILNPPQTGDQTQSNSTPSNSRKVLGGYGTTA